ncbi:hypothetical protein E4U52_006180 [Claviceps spartinae]|nr:hypothetical protein E4U52_006180 [Claviceps spartinae]
MANEDNNQDLFWALKGGGGGTFGVVTEATVRVFPDDPVTVTSTKIEAAAANVLFWKEGVHELLRLLQRFNKLHVAGQLVISAPTKDSLQAGLELHFANLTDETHAIRLLLSEAKSLETHGISASTSVRVQRKASSELRMKPDMYPPHYGILEATVLISAAIFNATGGPALIASKLSELTLKPNDILFTSNLGGRVSENTAIEIALHPAWREAAQLVTLVRAVKPSVEGKLSALDNLTAQDVPVLYSIDPTAKISYRNLGDPQEKEFQARYWGADNYARLAATKAAWDPSHLFMTSLGVGSEVWDAEGICRKRRGFRAKASSLIGMK